jgi:sugar-specific transcriptional regulator TrmB
MKITEIRHLDNIKGNFGLVDRKWYYASANSHEGEGISQQIFATTKEFVDQQQLFYDTLWSKAIPARNRIKEIEEGQKREFIETLQDPEEIRNLISRVISSATEEIDIVLSTSNTFKRYEKEGVIELITRKAEDGIKVRILLNHYDDIKPIIERYCHMSLSSKRFGCHQAKFLFQELLKIPTTSEASSYLPYHAPYICLIFD